MRLCKTSRAYRNTPTSYKDYVITQNVVRDLWPSSQYSPTRINMNTDCQFMDKHITRKIKNKGVFR
jgi:hypothetical protein